MNDSAEQYPAPVIWITGLSGAGKSTLATEVCAQIKHHGATAVLLDGDEFRKVIDDNLGHDPNARLVNAFRLARMAKLISDQGVTVVCATMSLFPEIWSWNRENISYYQQIYLKADKETLEARDNKGLYRAAREGKQENIIGWDLAFEEPLNSDLVLMTSDYSLKTLPQIAQKIINHCSAPKF